jgi:hypothetical protein
LHPCNSAFSNFIHTKPYQNLLYIFVSEKKIEKAVNFIIVFKLHSGHKTIGTNNQWLPEIEWPDTGWHKGDTQGKS